MTRASRALLVGVVFLAACRAAAPPLAPEEAHPSLPDAATAPRPGSARDAGRPHAQILLQTSKTATGEAIEYPRGAASQVVSQIVTIGPGQTTGWHTHGAPAFGYILSGSIDLEYEGLGRRRLATGDRLVESLRTRHNAANTSPEPARILVVFMSAQGTPNTVKAEPPPMPPALARGRAADLVELPQDDAAIRVDLRYASDDNFTGRVVYPSAHAFLQRPAAHALRRVSARAREHGYGVLVLDAYRPWSVTRTFWDEFPMHRAYLADPLEGSRHNRGCAVDVTLYELATGREVAMPSGYDDFSERAHPEYRSGTASERASRDLLRSLMEAERFHVYTNEWWHFDYEGWQDYAVLDLPFELLVKRESAASGAR